METSYLAILFLLVFIVLLYFLIGLLFLKKRKRLKPYFLLGFLIGITGGFIVFYILHTTKGSSYNILFTWWKVITTLAILLGGSISFYLYYKFFRK